MLERAKMIKSSESTAVQFLPMLSSVMSPVLGSIGIRVLSIPHVLFVLRKKTFGPWKGYCFGKNKSNL